MTSVVRGDVALRASGSAAMAAVLLTLVATAAAGQDTAACATSDARGGFRLGECAREVSRWNRRTNSRQRGAQQGIFPILGFDWWF